MHHIHRLIRTASLLILVGLIFHGFGAQAAGPEPAGWYSGDMHVHRSCGSTPESVSSIYNGMVDQNLAVVSLLADMGNGEVQDATTDLPLVNGQDASVSTAGRIVHWDAEWHWDATYNQYPNQALGGHIVALGLKEAHQIWDEYTYPIFQWAHQQGAIAGFAHLQYLGDGIPQDLNCCLPVEYPVEVALGACDFISEDVDGGDSAMNAYYRLLNCGFRPGFSGGSDHPCAAAIGSVVTYVQVPNALTYAGWIQGIAKGRTVVSRSGHSEFLDFKVNNSATPGDEIFLTGSGDVSVTVQWTAASSLSGSIELVSNGVVVASKTASVTSGTTATLNASVSFSKSGWLAARRMSSTGHEVHTAAVFVTVDGAPVRASVNDANFYVAWMDALLKNTSPGGIWNGYFPTKLSAAQARYQAARSVFQQIALEAGAGTTTMLGGIWSATAVPKLVDGGADAPVELGVRFQSDVDGVVTGIRFYKASTNTGTHIGNLWSNTGVKLASAPFASETASGWQQVNFASPVNITANTVYVASYHANTGHYSADVNYFASGGMDNPPLHALSGNGVYAYGTTSAFPTATWNTTNYWVDVAFQPATAPTLASIAVLPANVTLSTGTSRQFAATGTYSDNSSKDVTSMATWNSSSPTAVTVSTGGLATALASGTSILSATVAGVTGTSQLIVQSGTVPIITTSTIWPATAVPKQVDGGADAPVELGVRFLSDVNGVVTGIRFYKTSANTGTHIGNLWSNTGVKLASATFASETASGWQQVNFASPVNITANTVYVASYHANTGHYSADENYFANGGVDNPPLHALKSGVSGGNGIYAYGTSSSFPSASWNNSNYWVDVAFQPGSGSGTSGPTIFSVSPDSGATGVSQGITPTVIFNKALNASTVSTNTFYLRDASSALVPATVSYSSATQTAILTPAKSLQRATLYTATVKGGAGGVADTNGTPMSQDVTWSFATAGSYGALGGGPGGPILVVSGTAAPFSPYYAEILLTEGLNAFALADISSLTADLLSRYDVVILGQIPLTPSQVTLFTDWVNAGGKLIAMKPDKQLAGLLGLADAGSSLAEGYLLVNTASVPGVGIVGQTLQFHGNADRYNLAGASSLATLYSSATTATPNPAVTLRSVGSNGGQAAAFTFDLAQSVVYTRQGNPAWAGQARDGLSPIRSDDLFYGAATSDLQPDWVDPAKIAIPQADEQQRLLANLILCMNSSKKLLPRFWYFPHGYRAAVVMTGDDHDNGGTAGRFDQELNLSGTSGSVAAWETIRSTSYVLSGASVMSNTQAASYNAAGFEIALHLNTGCSDWNRASLEAYFTDQQAQFKSLYPSLPTPTTHRTHCVAWSDYTTMAEVELQHGIRLDTTYYYYPSTWVGDKPGFFTGSGMPMRFAKADGSVIDVYQAPTQMTDESGQSYPQTIDALLDKALGAEGYYGAFVANMHTDTVASPGSDAIISSAINRGVPIITARQLLVWADARNNSAFQSVAWNNGTLSFTVTAYPDALGLQAMAPVPTGSNVSALKYNGVLIRPSFRKVKGIEYAMFPALSGTYQLTYTQDATPPVVQSIQPAPGATGVSLSAGVSVNFSEPIDAATINANTVTLQDSANTPVSAKVGLDASSAIATLTPFSRLKAATTYTLLVKGGVGGVTDPAGNGMPNDYRASFITTSGTGQVYSIWDNTTTPYLLSANDANAVELGMKFRSATSGTLTAIRFYKGEGNTGTHVGNVWTANGTLLSTVTFAGETASGWQTQALSTPVAITANTVYVVSYHTNSGHYSWDSDYFAASGVDNAPLHALKDGESGGNGVYLYGNKSGFPNQTWKSSNYWVDVVFVPSP